MDANGMIAHLQESFATLQQSFIEIQQSVDEMRRNLDTLRSDSDQRLTTLRRRARRLREQLEADTENSDYQRCINRLPTRKYVHANYSARGGNSEGRVSRKRMRLNAECHVCLTNYKTDDELRRLPCFHEFHTSCIDPWLKIKQSCPVCRTKIDSDA